MKHRVLIGALATLAGSLTLAAQSDPGRSGQSSTSPSTDRSKASQSSSQMADMSGKLNSTDRRFVMDAAQGGMLEVELGRMVASKASSDDVKQYAQRMVDDHGKANDQLKQVAEKKSITLPTTLDAKHQHDLDRFSKMSGAELDKAYMEQMYRDHQKDVAEFRKASERSSDPDVKNFASSTLPTLEEHLHQAHDTGVKVGANVGRAGSEADRSADRNKTKTGTSDTTEQGTKKGTKKDNTTEPEKK